MGDDINKTPTPNKEQLIESMFSALKNSSFREAKSYCKQILQIDAECAEAYLGMLMCEYKVSSKDEFTELDEPFDCSENYIKILHYGNEELVSQLKDYVLKVNESIYNEAADIMKNASAENDFYQASCLFESIPNYKDAAHLARQCARESEIMHNDKIYNSAVDRLRHAETWVPNDTTIQAYEASIAELKTISEWKDAQEKLAVYQAKLFDLRVQAEKNREIRAEKAKSRKKAKRIKIAVTAFVLLIAVTVSVVLSVFLLAPETQYHTLNLQVTSENYEDQYARYSKYKDFEPVKNLLKKFIWLPSSEISSSKDSYLATRMDYKYETSPRIAEGTLSTFFSFGKPTEDPQWITLDLDTQFEFTYDDSGKIIEKRLNIDGKTTTTKYTYDESGNCIEETYSDTSGNITTKTHRLNTDGTIKKSISVDKNNKETTHEYTYNNKSISQEVITDPKGNVTTIDYEYDENGNCVRKTTSNEDGDQSTVEYHDYEMYYIGA